MTAHTSRQIFSLVSITGEVEAKMCMIACSAPPEGKERWTMQMIADKLIELKAVEYITDSTVCDTLKKMN